MKALAKSEVLTGFWITLGVILALSIFHVIDTYLLRGKLEE